MDDLSGHPAFDWPVAFQTRTAVRSVRDELHRLALTPDLSLDLRCDVLAALAEADAESAELTLRMARAQAAQVAAGRPLPATPAPKPRTPARPQ